MRSILRKLLSTILPLAIAAGSPNLARSQDNSSQGAYRISGLGSLLGESLPVENRPYRLNENSQVVGYVNEPNSKAQAAIWQNGSVTAIGTYPAGTITKGHAINVSGSVVGIANDRFGQTFGGLYQGGQWQSLLYPTTGNITYTTASAISNSGVIVGWGTTSTFDTAIRTPLVFFPGGNTHPVALSTLPGDRYGAAFDVKNAGVAVGYSSSDSTGNVNHPVSWNTSTGAATALAGANVNGTANSISNSGEIVGNVAIGTNTFEAVKFANGNFAPLTKLAGETSSVASAVNDNGTIVGSVTIGSGSSTVQHAYLSTGSPLAAMGGTKIDLNTMQTSGWTLNTASDVNSQGQIVGTGTLGGSSLGYIATPELHRMAGASAAWEAANSWSWGLPPGAQHPVYIDNATVNGPLSNTTVGELNIGTSAAATLSLSSGLLTVNNRNAIWANGYTTLGAFGTLSGSGMLQSNLMDFGTISPGSSPGTLTIDGNVTFMSTSVTYMQIFGDLLGQFDLLKITGTASFGGELLLDFSSYSGALNSPITILTAGGSNEYFQSIQIVGIDPSSVRLDFENGFIGLSITSAAVPEPRSFVMLALGVFMVLIGKVLLIVRRSRAPSGPGLQA